MDPVGCDSYLLILISGLGFKLVLVSCDQYRGMLPLSWTMLLIRRGGSRASGEGDED